MTRPSSAAIAARTRCSAGFMVRVRRGTAKAGRDHQAGHAPQPGQAILVGVLVQGGMPESGRGPPADADVVELGQAEVHRPVDENIEAQPAAGAELQHADAALAAVIEHDCADDAGRGEVAGRALDRPAAGLGGTGAHDITHPPSTPIVWPVTNAESGPARNDTTAASSAGVPRRLSACRSSTYWWYAAGSAWISSAAVGNAPGATAFTRIPAGPSSLASA